MKKNLKNLLCFLSLFVVALTGCNTSTPQNNDPTNDIYDIYKNEGGELSYEEWLKSIKGADGSSILYGDSDPTTQGNNGDVYINSSTWDIFVKNGGNWVKIGNIMGQEGPKGDKGEPGNDGHTPVVTIGENGHWFVDGVDTGVKANGEDGVSVVKTEIDENGDLIITLSNGNTINAGNVVNKTKYTVTFYSTGGSAVNSQTIQNGGKATKPEDPVREGYEFVDWVDKDDNRWLFNIYPVTENLELFATWRACDYTVSFNANGGLGSMDPVSVKAHTSFTIPENGFTARRDSEFIGWKIDGEVDLLQPGDSIVITNDISLLALWRDDISNISIRNLYFSDYQGGDYYLEEIEDKFGVKFNLSTYDYVNWDEQVYNQVNSDNLPDVFHANVKSDNFGTYYKCWAEEGIIKPLPTNLDKWPNIKYLIEHTSNIEHLKIDGLLYGIPVAKDTTDYSTNFSPFTYIYRRDWAKQYGVYQENDEYTWEQFENLLSTFASELDGSGSYALGDAEWGFPSIVNFYKTTSGCYAQDTNGQYVNNFTTSAYITGLNKAKTFLNNGWYYPDQHMASSGDLNTKYCANKIGVLFENLTYSNYATIQNRLKKANPFNQNFNVDDATAIMKIKGEDGKYALEGAENWFSMTLFCNEISDSKLEKILDIFDWLLSEEGTRMSVFGLEGYDYEMVDGEPVLVEENWPKDNKGNYVTRTNGARNLRYAVSLGYDLNKYDPLTDHHAANYLHNWDQEMKTALASGQLRVVAANPEVAWLSTERKSLYTGYLLNESLISTLKYVYGQYNYAQYSSAFNNSYWAMVLAEINGILGQ